MRSLPAGFGIDYKVYTSIKSPSLCSMEVQWEEGRAHATEGNFCARTFFSFDGPRAEGVILVVRTGTLFLSKMDDSEQLLLEHASCVGFNQSSRKAPVARKHDTQTRRRKQHTPMFYSSLVYT